MSAVLLKNCNLIDETGVITAGEDLLIREGVIAARGTGLSLAEGEAGEALDCSGLFVSPGFTILHAHSPMHILRGVAEDVNVNDWFNREIWPYESKIQEEDIYWGAKLCCAEMLDHGVTAFADHYFHGEQIARAAKESGIRADIAGTVFAFDGNPEPEMKAVEALMDQYRGDPMVKLRFGPHSPYICSPEVLRTLVEAARDLGASSFRAFWTVTFKMTLPGLLSGVVLTFIPSMGLFFIADLLGGNKIVLVGSVIQEQLTKGRNQPFAAALSAVLMILTTLMIRLYRSVTGTNKLEGLM